MEFVNMVQRCFLIIAFSVVVLERFTVLSRCENNIVGIIEHYDIRRSHKSSCSKKHHHHREEKTDDYWFNLAQASLAQRLAKHPTTGTAKNVIMFLGEGMSSATLTAARTYLQQRSSIPKEEAPLSFERFPYVGFSKISCVDTETPDYACSATAYLCGIQANKGTIGVTTAVPFGDCKAMQNESTHVCSIARWAQLEGKRTGIVTTSKITHGYPAGIYAHTANSEWECDTEVIKAGFNAGLCNDLATQLVYSTTGTNLNVIFGSGRQFFLPKVQKNCTAQNGFRSDTRDLTEEWQRGKRDVLSEYVHNRTGMLQVPGGTEYLLGLFDDDDINLNKCAKPVKPTLSEMIENAIRLLSQGDRGYFLFIHDGGIDHHSTKTQKSLNEIIEFHKAVKTVVDLTNSGNTLIVVISDHWTIENNTGKNCDLPHTSETDGKISSKRKNYKEGRKLNDLKKNFSNMMIEYPALAPRNLRESRAGEDVKIYATGPWAHLLSGIVEQHVIPHVMAYASCVGKGRTVCDDYS